VTAEDFARIMRGDVLRHVRDSQKLGLVTRVSRPLTLVCVLWEDGSREDYQWIDARNLEHGA
jgi:hypothetical protein